MFFISQPNTDPVSQLALGVAREWRQRRGEVDAVAQSLQRPHSVVQHEAARLFLAKMKVLSSIVQQARDKFALAACENDPHFIAFCSTVAAILLDEQE